MSEDVLPYVQAALEGFKKIVTEMEKNLEVSPEKIAEAGSTSCVQPTYIDSKGEVFTAARIITEGFRPTGKYKGHSISEKVNSPEYGKLQRK